MWDKEQHLESLRESYNRLGKEIGWHKGNIENAKNIIALNENRIEELQGDLLNIKMKIKSLEDEME